MKRTLSLLLFVLFLVMTKAASATNWYVRADGGTRYSSAMTQGQCNGQADVSLAAAKAALGGHINPNMACAFNDFRYLYQDGSYADDSSNSSFPHWGWVLAGGDTAIIRGSIGTGVSYRIGWNNPNNVYDAPTNQYWGLAGDPFDSMPPPLPSGTAAQPTRLLGENYGACTTASAKTQLHGGYGLGEVLNMAGVSHADVECLDITDFSSCGLAGQQNECNKNLGQISDFAKTGIYWDNAATNDTLTDINIHGMAINGMQGPPGDNVVITRIGITGNASSGWNTDNGTVGVGSLLVQNFNISWNGCAEEYPVVDALPYQDCNDDGNGGYGDGFGTATIVSTIPWNVHFDQGVVSYNTQDGLDALHLNGAGSSMTITRVLAYGNMGEQLKNGGSNGTLENNVIVGNCYALQNAIPGTPAGYNTHLSDFCRAGNNGVLMTTGKGANVVYRGNTLYSPNLVGILFQCDSTEGQCDSTSTVDVRDNIFIGYVGPYSSDFPTYIYLDQGTGQAQFPANVNPFQNPGSINSNNVTYNAKSNWTCPALWQAEQNALCSDPSLTDETLHPYGYNNAAPRQGSLAIGSGSLVSALTEDFNGLIRPTPPSRGAVDVGTTPTAPTPPSAPSAPTAPTAPTSPTTPTAPTPPTSPTTPTAPTSPTAPTAPTTPTPPTTPTSPTTPSSPTTPTPPTPPSKATVSTVAALAGSKGPNAANPLVLTVTVKATNSTPTGSVAIYSGSNQIIAVSSLNKSGSASWTAPAAIANQTFHAVYSGTSTYKSSISGTLNGAGLIAAFFGN